MGSPKKNLLIISNMYPSARNNTYGIFVKNQVKHLRKQGLKVDVLAISDPRRGKFHTIKKHFWWIIKAFFILVFKGQKYDVVHAHYIFPSGWLALLFKKVYKAKVIVTSHGGDIDQMPHKSRYVYNQTKKVLQKSDGIIAVGEHLKHEMVNTFDINAKKIKVMNMGVDREIFTPKNKEDIKQKLNLKENCLYILFVGNIIKSKGIIDLLEAFSLLRRRFANIELHMIGACPDEAFQAIVYEKIKKDHLSNVFIHKPMNQRQLALWMAAVDVFVLPSHIEGFGLVALEAMSVHTPVVGTKVGGLKYLLKDFTGILVEAKNDKSLANGIEQVLTNRELQRKLMKNGEKVAEKYNINNIIKKLHNIYEKSSKEQRVN